MSYLEELLPEFRNGAKIRQKCWNEAAYIEFKYNVTFYNNFFTKNDKVDISKNDWEFYQEPIDWDYIIKNKCLCWFCDNQKADGIYGILTSIRKDKLSPFMWSDRIRWINCRPVRRDEVTFYEDKENE